VTAFVPAVENMVSGRAQRPGDIVTSLNGKTIEVLNTDAEGRLILNDAITYAQQLGCTHLVDAATLTGAIVVALGYVNIGAFTNNEAMLARVMAAAKDEGEKMWHMPLDDEYKEPCGADRSTPPAPMFARSRKALSKSLYSSSSGHVPHLFAFVLGGGH